MASSIEVMAHTKTGYHHNKSIEREEDLRGEEDHSKKGHSETSFPQSAPDSMPMGDGSEVNWSESVLGRPLLCRCVNLLRQNGDLQTLATVVCIFGGGVQLVSLMTPGEIDCFASFIRSGVITCTPACDAIDILSFTFLLPARLEAMLFDAKLCDVHCPLCINCIALYRNLLKCSVLNNLY